MVMGHCTKIRSLKPTAWEKTHRLPTIHLRGFKLAVCFTFLGSFGDGPNLWTSQSWGAGPLGNSQGCWKAWGRSHFFLIPPFLSRKKRGGCTLKGNKNTLQSLNITTLNPKYLIWNLLVGNIFWYQSFPCLQLGPGKVLQTIHRKFNIASSRLHCWTWLIATSRGDTQEISITFKNQQSSDRWELCKSDSYLW